MVFYYDFDNNKIIIDGVAYNGPEGEEDMAIALRRIQMALERKRKKENEAKAKAEKSKKKKHDDKVWLLNAHSQVLCWYGL
ncbi:hypothetical protein AgCh_010324 [Apium graveolens]